MPVELIRLFPCRRSGGVTFGAAIVVALLAAGCGGDADAKTASSSASDGRFELTASTTSPFPADTLMSLDASLTNVGDQVVTPDGDCVADFRLVVLDEDGRAVFNLYDYLIETEFNGQVPECPPTSYPLEPGESYARSLPFRAPAEGDYTIHVSALSETVGDTSVPLDLSVDLEVEAE
jgi:hypothetical protein